MDAEDNHTVDLSSNLWFSEAWCAVRKRKEVGTAILDFCEEIGTPRSELGHIKFYMIKLKLNNAFVVVNKPFQTHLITCRLGYIDLYLIHGPLNGPKAQMKSWRIICDF